jgi:prepilin-type N-terminal cleavage/methylation domain-containing protein
MIRPQRPCVVHPCRRGFTLIELSITSVIALLIGLVLITVYRSNLTTWRWGQKHMEFNQKIQLAMKQVFTDIKRINPLVATDDAGNIWFKGEKGGDLVPNLVTLISTDQDLSNGGEEITFVHTSFSRPDARIHVRIFTENGALLREVTDHNGTRTRVVIADRVKDLHFIPNPEDIYEVRVQMTVSDDRNPELIENLQFAVRIDTDLVCVKLVTNDV